MLPLYLLMHLCFGISFSNSMCREIVPQYAVTTRHRVIFSHPHSCSSSYPYSFLHLRTPTPKTFNSWFMFNYLLVGLVIIIWLQYSNSNSSSSKQEAKVLARTYLQHHHSATVILSKTLRLSKPLRLTDSNTWMRGILQCAWLTESNTQTARGTQWEVDSERQTARGVT